MSVVVVARLHPAEGRRDDALAAVSAAVPGILAEDGCELYAPHRADDGTIVLVEKWASRDALAAHNTGSAVEVLRAGVKGLMAAPTEVTVTEPVAGLPASAAV